MRYNGLTHEKRWVVTIRNQQGRSECQTEVDSQEAIEQVKAYTHRFNPAHTVEVIDRKPDHI